MRSSGSGLAVGFRARALRALEAALLLDAGLLVWVSATGGFVVPLGVVELSVTSARGPGTILLLGLAAHLVLRGTLRALLALARDRFASASNLRRAGMAASLALAFVSLRSWARVPGILAETPLAFSGMALNSANLHVPDLVYRVVSRPAGETPVVHVEDVDPRAHFASYYCYPRALRMEPGRRRWSLISRVVLFWETEYDDPGFAPEPLPPPLAASEDYARSLGAPLIVEPGLAAGYASLWTLAQPPVEPLAFVESEAHAGLLDVAPRAFASWSDVDRDGLPDLVLGDGPGCDRALLFNRDGLRFEASDGALAGADTARTPPGGSAADDPRALVRAAMAGGRAGDVARALVQSGFGDLDGDGDLDALAVDAHGACRLLLDRGDGALVDATPGSGLEHLQGASSCALGDIEGDGRLDAYVACEAGGVLLRNLGGRFEDVTRTAGLPALPGRAQARFADFDDDGLDDLYVATAPLGGVRARDNALFLNAGGGTFAQLPVECGAGGSARGGVSLPAVCDYDRDGDLDLLLAGGIDPMFLGGPTLLASRGNARESVRVEVSDDAVALRAVTARRFVLSRSLSQMAGNDGSERGAHLGLGESACLRYVQVVLQDGRLAAVQGVPPASVVVLPTDARRSSLIASHPAALLGEVATFDLEATRARIAALWGTRAPPATDDGEIARRTAAVLARAQALRVARDVRVPPFEDARLFEEERRLSVLPERLLVEHIAVADPAPDLDGAPPEPGGTHGGEPISVSRRWTSRAALQSLLPAELESAFASVETGGSSADDAALGRYGQLAAPKGAGEDLVGFVAFRAPGDDGREVTHLVRSWAREAGGVVPAAWFDAELSRAARDRALRAALGPAARDEGADATWLGSIPCSTAALADAARAAGLERDAAVVRAVERLRREVELDALVAALIESHEPGESELAEEVQRVRALRAQEAGPQDPTLERDLARATLRRRFALGLLDRVLVWRAR